jgi:hypothetical protein
MDTALSRQECLQVSDRPANRLAMSRIGNRVERGLQTLYKAFGRLAGRTPADMHFRETLMVDVEIIAAARVASIVGHNDASWFGVHSSLLTAKELQRSNTFFSV